MFLASFFCFNKFQGTFKENPTKTSLFPCPCHSFIGNEPNPLHHKIVPPLLSRSLPAPVGFSPTFFKKLVQVFSGNLAEI